MIRKNPKCSKGFPCGKTCINRNNLCWANLSTTNNRVAETFSQFVNRIVGIGTSTQSVINNDSNISKTTTSSIMEPTNEMRENLVEFFKNSPFFQKKLERVKNAYTKLNDFEAMGVALWISDSYAGMNNLLYNEYSEDEVFEEDYKYVAANYYADRAIRSGKIPFYTKENMEELANNSDKYDYEDFNKLGRLSRGIDGLSQDKKNSLINKYKNLVGKEIKEKIFFATTAFEPSQFAFTSNAQILFEVIPKEKSSGVMVDAGKNELFEGEVLYPPGQKFKVLSAEESYESLSNLSMDDIEKMSKKASIKKIEDVLNISDLESYKLLDISKVAFNLKEYGSNNLDTYIEIMIDRFPFLTKEQINELYKMDFNIELKTIINEIESKGGIFIENVFKIILEEI